MNQLKPLKNRHKHHLNEIINSKNGDRRKFLTKNVSKLETLFDDYEVKQKNNSLEGITVTALNLRGKLAKYSLHCYNGQTAALNSLKEEIRENQKHTHITYCPYCGIGHGAQFDHYIPKTKFPEYSAHALNLIPCCSTCNGKKSETWLVSNERVFINFYIDRIPSSQYLFTDIAWTKTKKANVPSATFKLVRPKGFSVASFKRIEEHYSRLELPKRFRESTPMAYENLLAAAGANPTNDEAIMKDRLQRFINRYSNNFGVNNWQVVVMSAMINDSTFIAQCIAL